MRGVGRRASCAAGRMNTVSEKFIPRASRCICSERKPLASGNTPELIALQRDVREDVDQEVATVPSRLSHTWA